jgi:hypothetical protein
MFDYAEQTLNPVTAKQAFPLNPLVIPAFNSMMNALGY